MVNKNIFRPVFSILEMTQRLDDRRQRMCAEITELGFTSLGFEGRYTVRGRTLYFVPTILAETKVAVFTRATMEQVERDEVSSMQAREEYFLEACFKRVEEEGGYVFKDERDGVLYELQVRDTAKGVTTAYRYRQNDGRFIDEEPLQQIRAVPCPLDNKNTGKAYGVTIPFFDR